MKKKSIHNDIVEYLYHNPIVLNIHDEILEKQIEYEMRNGINLYVVPDLYFHTLHNYFFFEIKSSHSKHCKEKGHLQMFRTYDWLQRHNNEIITRVTIGLVRPTTKRQKLDDIVRNLDVSYLVNNYI